MSQRGRGGIIFVASIGGYASLPYNANYMATKAYLLSLGEALHYELKEKGVDVTVLCPGGTNTRPKGFVLEVKGLDPKRLLEMSGKGMAVTPVVASALKAVGQKPAVIPGLKNKIMLLILTKLFSRKATTSIFAKMIKKAVLQEYL